MKFYDVEDQIEESEEIISNPSNSQLINATKISGRTKNGLGIGLFNATASETFAIIEDTETGKKRNVQTDPLTNYNIFVLDQNLKNNSFLSFINTNVLRSGTDYDANVTGTEFSIKNKDNSYAVNGTGALSQKYYSQAVTDDQQDSVGLGYSYRLEFEKTRGNFKYGIQYNVDSRHYNINDLGINFRPNRQTLSARFNYNIFKPFGPFNRAGAWSWMQYARLEEQNQFTSFEWNFRSFFVTRDFFAFGAFGNLQPFKNHDYFEPRTEDFSYFYALPRNGGVGVWGSSDFRKRFAYEFDIGITNFATAGRKTIEVSVEPRVRVNDKLFFKLEVESSILKNDIGYVSPDEEAQGYLNIPEEDIIFSRRNQIIFENTFAGNYIFTNNMSLTLRARHYWTRVEYQGFNTLQLDGSLSPTAYKGLDSYNNSLHNASFNIFNIDMVYRWRFAPGSDLFFVWKNSISKDSDDINKSYLFNLKNLLDAPQVNSFSLKVVYFLDYLDIKNRT